MCVAWRVSFGKPARASSAPNHPLAARLEVLSTIGVGLSTKISDTQSIKRNAEVHEQGKLLRGHTGVRRPSWHHGYCQTL